MIKPIIIKNMDDVIEINRVASGSNYETWVHSKDSMVDAKSLLGLSTMINKPNLIYVVPDDVNPKKAFKGILKFAV